MRVVVKKLPVFWNLVSLVYVDCSAIMRKRSSILNRCYGEIVNLHIPTLMPSMLIIRFYLPLPSIPLREHFASAGSEHYLMASLLIWAKHKQRHFDILKFRNLAQFLTLGQRRRRG